MNAREIIFPFGNANWVRIWRKKGFKNWHECHDWLKEDYNATASNQGTGIRLYFPDHETVVSFQLAWLS